MGVMARILTGLAVAAVLLLSFLLYRSCTSDNRLNVDPHASKEIEKAKQR
jgi:hypothetical protein